MAAVTGGYDYGLTPVATDGAGYSSRTGFLELYKLEAEPEPVNEDPSVTDLDPAPGATLGAQEAVKFTVWDQDGVGATEIQAQQQALEVVYQDGAFPYPYARSGRVQVTDGDATGYRYTIRRTGGWVTAPTLKVRARE